MSSTASRTWRPFGYWALSINAALGFPSLVVLTILGYDTQLGVLAGAFASILATWAAAAGIRQWGKNAGTELAYEEYSLRHSGGNHMIMSAELDTEKHGFQTGNEQQA